MSRSNSTELINPAQKFYSWSGDKGLFFYFDKTKGEKGERVEVKLPFRFLVLDTLNTMKGWDDVAQSGYWANECRDIKKEILTVRNKNGICASGLYSEVSRDRNTVGAKYVQSVYIAIKGKNGLEIANIQMVGSALNSWIDFRKKNKIFDGAIEVAEMVEATKGKTVYQIPVFKKIATTPESEEQAVALDKELQEYLSLYFKKSQTEVTEHHSIEVAEEDVKTRRDAEEDDFTNSMPPVDDEDSLPF